MKSNSRANRASLLHPRRDPLLKIKAVAQRLDVSPRHAYELVALKKFPAVRLGNRLRVDARDLEDYINQHKE